MPGPAAIMVLLGGLWYLDREKQRTVAQGAVGRPPLWTTEAVNLIAASGDGGIRTLREDVRDRVLAWLDLFALEEIDARGAPGMLFRVVERTPGVLSARVVLEEIRLRGGLVLASLTCALLGGDEEKLVFVTRPRHRILAGPLSHFALLWPEKRPTPKVEIAPPPPVHNKAESMPSEPEPSAVSDLAKTMPPPGPETERAPPVREPRARARKRKPDVITVAPEHTNGIATVKPADELELAAPDGA